MSDTTTTITNAFRTEPTFLRTWEIDQLEKDMGTMIRRARKLGVDEPKLVRTGNTRIVEIKTNIGTRVKVQESEVVIEGVTPRLPGGWRLLASVDHTDHVVDVVPGEDCPADQRDRGPVCDHCGTTNKQRKKTMVLQDEAGKVVQVGTTCIGDFLGAWKHNPQHVLNMSTMARDLLVDAHSDGGEPVGGWKAHTVVTVDEVLLWTARWLVRNSWVSATVAREYDKVSTAAEISDFIWPPHFSGPGASHYRAEFLAKKDKIENTMVDEAELQAAQDWALAEAKKDDASDYIKNLGELVSAEVVQQKRVSYVASLLPSYRRAMERKVSAEREAAEVKVAVPEGRQEFTGRVLSVKEKDNGFDIRLVMTVRVETETGVFRLWGTVPSSLRDDEDLVGKTVIFTATTSRSDRDDSFGFFKRPAKAKIA